MRRTDRLRGQRIHRPNTLRGQAVAERVTKERRQHTPKSAATRFPDEPLFRLLSEASYSRRVVNCSRNLYGGQRRLSIVRPLIHNVGDGCGQVGSVVEWTRKRHLLAVQRERR